MVLTGYASREPEPLYIPLTTWSTVVIWCLYAKILMRSILPAGMELLDPWFHTSTLEAKFPAIPTLVGYPPEIDFAFSLVTGVAFLQWLALATGNLHFMKLDQKPVTPNFIVASWFIPIWNLWAPYQHVCQIYKGSDPRADFSRWQEARVPRRILVWWLLWNACGFVPLTILSQLLSSTLFPSDRAWWITNVLIGGGLNAIAGILAIQIISAITTMQHQKYHMLQLQQAAASANQSGAMETSVESTLSKTSELTEKQVS